MLAGGFLSLLMVIVIGGEKLQTPRAHGPTVPVVYPKDFCQNIQSNEKFDYIIVGSGPAGSTVARRLAENPNSKVLLLEAGDDPRPASDFYTPSPEPGELWNITTKPSATQCAGHKNKQCFLTVSKTLGGCSVINAELYVRGNPQDYEDWEGRGNPGWGWKDMLPYFLKLENLRDPHNKVHADPGYHSTKGPFTTAPFPADPYSEDLRAHLKESISSMGLALNNDINGKSQIGFGDLTGLVEETGYRNNVAKSYLLNIPDNLKVCKRSLVQRFLVSPKKAVQGVEFVYTNCTGSICEDKTMVMKAKKEYILTAGPLNSPQILERSGIGRKSVLENAGVELVHELNGVGENLQEQFINLQCSFDVKLNNAVAKNPLTAKMTSFTGFFNQSDKSSPVPDTQFFLISEFPIPDSYQPQISKQFEGIPDVLVFGSVILRQSKRGHVHITGTNPHFSPDFNPSQYTSDEEAQLNTKACQLARKIMTTPPMAKFEAKPIVLKECQKYPFNSKEEIMCGAYLIPLPSYHYAGTAAMGPKSDANAVVDSRLRVHGIDKLRVADLSVMPDVSRGNTEVPTIAVAEHAADIIKEDSK